MQHDLTMNSSWMCAHEIMTSFTCLPTKHSLRSIYKKKLPKKQCRYLWKRNINLSFLFLKVPKKKFFLRSFFSQDGAQLIGLLRFPD